MLRSALMMTLLVVGCGKSGVDTGAESGIDGIWLVWIPFSSADDCSDEISHNFSLAYTQDDEDLGAWNSDSTEERSGALTAVQITSLGDGEAAMIVGSEIFPGTETEGVWLFSWSGSDATNTSTSHDLGYSYLETSSSSSEITMELTFTGDTAVGTWSESSFSVESWTESDTWSKEVGIGSIGQMPVGNWLVYDDMTGKPPQIGVPQNNQSSLTECTGDCFLEVSTTCTSSFEVEVSRTGFEDAEAYEHLSGAGQNYGS